MTEQCHGRRGQVQCQRDNRHEGWHRAEITDEQRRSSITDWPPALRAVPAR